MSEASESRQPATVHRLAQAMREIRSDLADRDDVVIELRETQRSRLELLAAELADVVAEVPEDQQIFDFAISSGLQPRFWIDAVAYVAMGRDRRTYRFVRETRAGRALLAESPDARPVADAVTRYVAERIVERQRSLEAPDGALGTVENPPAVARRSGVADMVSSFALFIMGGLVGVVAVLAVLRERIPELQSLFN